jgi:mRNA interferase MazF
MSIGKSPRRGELWLAEFDPVVGREQGGFRPALVLSTDAFNAGANELVAVMPLTTQVRGWNLHVPISPPEGGLHRPSVIMCEQLRFFSRDRLDRRLGAVETATLRAVMVVLRRLLET